MRKTITEAFTLNPTYQEITHNTKIFTYSSQDVMTPWPKISSSSTKPLSVIDYCIELKVQTLNLLYPWAITCKENCPYEQKILGKKTRFTLIFIIYTIFMLHNRKSSTSPLSYLYKYSTIFIGLFHLSHSRNLFA